MASFSGIGQGPVRPSLSLDSVSVFGQSLRSNGQDRTAGERDDTRRNATQENATEPGAAVGPEHDEVGPCGSGRPQDAIVGDSLEEETLARIPRFLAWATRRSSRRWASARIVRDPPVVDLPRDEALSHHGDDNRIDVSDSERGASGAREIEGPAERGA